MDLTINSANDITTKLFVKERITNPDTTTNDVFVTVANAVDIEDYSEDNPGTGDVYFRSNSISLVTEDSTLLDSIFAEVMELLSLVCQQMTDLETYSTVNNYTVTPSGYSPA